MVDLGACVDPDLAISCDTARRGSHRGRWARCLGSRGPSWRGRGGRRSHSGGCWRGGYERLHAAMLGAGTASGFASPTRPIFASCRHRRCLRHCRSPSERQRKCKKHKPGFTHNDLLLRFSPVGGFSEGYRIAISRGATGGRLGLMITPASTTSTFAAG
jgi:hypothetical protein